MEQIENEVETTAAPESRVRPARERTHDPSRVAALLRAQGIFYVASGVWPILNLASFEAVTGPKVDGWLVKTIGGLIATIGVTLARAGRKRPTGEAVLLGVASAGVLGCASGWYALRGRVSKIYLLDSAVELGIVMAYLARGERAIGRRA